MIVPLGPEHVAAVARLHVASLPGLLGELGAPATRAYYTGCVRTPAALGFVDVVDGAVRGFVMGSAHPDTLKREVLRRNPVATVAALALGVLRRPSSMVWLLRSGRGPDEGSYDSQAPELIYLAVDGAHRASGVGKRLLDAFTCAMRETGVPSFQLSVHEENTGAIGFYEAQGFQMTGRYREFGALHRRYKLEWR